MRKYHWKQLCSCIIAMMLLACTVSAQASRERVKVRFAKGKSSAVLRGRLVGYEFKEYLINARAGQTMSLKLAQPKPYASFTIYSINGQPAKTMAPTDEWSETLAESGEYIVRVAMSRADARRPGAKINYTLTVSIQ